MSIRFLLPVLLVTLSACGGGLAPNAGGTNDAGSSPGDGGPSDASAFPDASSGDGGSFDAGWAPDATVGGGNPPVTVATPPGETYIGALTVTLTSTPAATIFYTTDGSDPRTSHTAVSGSSPVTVTLSPPAQITLTYSAADAQGTETPQVQQYTVLQNLQPASIAGELVVPPLLQSGTAAVLLFNENPAATANAEPLQIMSVSPGAPGGAQYAFQGLPAGTYWIAAEWWPGATMTNGTDALALRNPITLNPTTPGDERADFVNVYIGQCDPAGPGVDGVVNVGSELLSESVAVAGFDTPLLVSGAGTPTIIAPAIGTGAQRPFALCTTSAADLYVLAQANPAGSQTANTYVAAAGNPLVTTPTSHIALDLGTTSAGMEGVLEGNVILNGPLPGGTVSVVLSQEPWANDELFLGMNVTASSTNTSQYPYAFEGLPPGTYYPAVALKSADGYSASFPVSTGVAFTGASTTMQNLNASVGRISGTVSIGGVPAGSGKTALLAVPVGGSAPVAMDVISLGAPAGGIESGAFVLFGLADGSYSVVAVVDENNDGNFSDDFSKGHDGTASTTPTVTGGDSVTLNFSITL